MSSNREVRSRNTGVVCCVCLALPLSTGWLGGERQGEEAGEGEGRETKSVGNKGNGMDCLKGGKGNMKTARESMRRMRRGWMENEISWFETGREMVEERKGMDEKKGRLKRGEGEGFENEGERV